MICGQFVVGRKLGSQIVLRTYHGGALRYNLQANNATRIQKDNDPNLVQGLSLCGQFLFIFGISTLKNKKIKNIHC